MADSDPIGATPADLASRPGLLLDLSLSLLPRRLALAHGLIALLGGTTKEKVRVLLHRVAEANRAMQSDPGRMQVDVYRAARDLSRAVAQLEDSLFGLVVTRLKTGCRVVPDFQPQTEAIAL